VSERGSDEPLTPAEQRLATLLALLQSELVRSRPGLVAAVMRRVRWQQLLRELVDALGGLASSVVRGVGVFLRGSPGQGTER
jgi:hypothetical protein